MEEKKMAFFDKLTQTASNVGKNVASSAAKVGSSAAVAAQEQTELAQLKSQVNVINQELDSFYVQIGRRYIDYAIIFDMQIWRRNQTD